MQWSLGKGGLWAAKWWFNIISEPKWSYHGDIYRNLPSGAIKHGKNSEVSMRSCWESHIELHGSVDFTIKKYEELTICRWFPWKKHGGYGFSLPCPAPPWVPWVPWVPRLPFSPMLKECSCGHAAGPVCCLLWLLRDMIEATKDESKPPLSNTP